MKLFFRDLYHEIVKDHLYLFAAALSFFIFLSLFPSLLLFSSMMSFYVLKPYDLPEKALNFATEYFLPAGQEFIKIQLYKLLSQSHSFALVGLLGTVVAASGLFATLQYVLSVVWEMPPQSPFFRRRLLALFNFFLACLFVGLSVLVMALLEFLRYRAGSLSVLLKLLSKLFPLAFSFFSFVFGYRILPEEQVHYKLLIKVCFVMSLLFELEKHFMAFYFSQFANFAALYGTLGSIMAFLLWIYVACFTFLIGAEAIQVLGGVKARSSS